jgi:hypothetical protein
LNIQILYFGRKRGIREVFLIKNESMEFVQRRVKPQMVLILVILR